MKWESKLKDKPGVVAMFNQVMNQQMSGLEQAVFNRALEVLAEVPQEVQNKADCMDVLLADGIADDSSYRDILEEYGLLPEEEDEEDEDDDS